MLDRAQKQVFGWMLCEVLRGRTRRFNFGRTFCALTRQKQNLCGTQTSGIKVTQHFRKGTSEVRIRGFPATAGCLGFSWIADGSMGWIKLDSDSAAVFSCPLWGTVTWPKPVSSCFREGLETLDLYMLHFTVSQQLNSEWKEASEFLHLYTDI